MLLVPNTVISALSLLSATGTTRIWHANTYRLESTLNYGMERAWCIACMRGSNNVSIGYDEGSIIISVSLVLSKLCNVLVVY